MFWCLLSSNNMDKQIVGKGNIIELNLVIVLILIILFSRLSSRSFEKVLIKQKTITSKRDMHVHMSNIKPTLNSLILFTFLYTLKLAIQHSKFVRTFQSLNISNKNKTFHYILKLVFTLLVHHVTQDKINQTIN